MKAVRKFLINTLLLFTTVILCLLGAEGVTRLVMPNSVKLRLMHKPDENLGYRLVPHYEMRSTTPDFDTFIKINSEGLRDREYPAGKHPAAYRILALGDSFTFGLGVAPEESYPKLLESLLNRSPLGGASRKFEVINAGVDGYGTDQEYRYLRELLGRYQPDLVMVGLYSNDIEDVMQGVPTAFSRTKLKNRVYFLSYLRSLQLLLSRSAQADLNDALFGLYQKPHPPQIEQGIDRVRDYLVKIRELSSARGAATLVVIIPFCLELDKAEWDKKGLGQLYTDRFFTENMGRFSMMFTEFGRTAGIPTLPLLPVLRDSTIRPLYFRQDPHWTREGHRQAADAIYEYLKREKLLRGGIPLPGRASGGRTP